MKIKAEWGFRGDAPKLNAESADVKAGDVFDGVDPEYGHALVGKGLAVQLHEGAAPKETKPAQPSEFKAGDGDNSAAAAPDTQANAVADGGGAQTASGDATVATQPTASVDAGTDGVADAGGTDDKQQLIQQLEAASVTFDRRWGAQRLAEVLADAQKSGKSE
ncbi:MAG TPA: hypothetical protein VN156_01265 [Pseudomonas sp.]|nr:hypothetical protein [Pseudomonas sp.]